MAATPPLQITSTPQTPPTPLHGAAYERRPTRQSTRIRQRAASHTFQSTLEAASPEIRGKRSVTTPKSSNLTSKPTNLHSPKSTPKKAARRVQVVSPSSPNTESSPPKPAKSSTSHLQPFLSSTTIMSEGMLPTPIKTPKKKNVPTASAAARALFQDQAMENELLAPSPRRSRKNKRYNGFSLESFNAEDDSNARIQIFTDNRDKIPEADISESNPFVDQLETEELPRTRKIAGGSKRRKISGERRLDPQVEDAINEDEGMVYVFRGKKVFRRFDDSHEEEEIIDEEDLGLLEHAEDGTARMKPLKIMTRKSVKPKRLFQTEQQKLLREQAQQEEALTDIEGDVCAELEAHTHGNTSQTDASVTRQGTRSNNVKTRSKTSPFDSWPRIKGGSRSCSASTGQKRTASEAIGEEGDVVATTSNTKQKRTRV